MVTKFLKLQKGEIHMDFETVLSLRQSTRAYLNKPVSEDDIEKLLSAAAHAPVGSKMYQDLHITVVQNQSIILKLCEAAWERFSSKEKVKEIAGDTVKDEVFQPKPNLFYGAPVVFFVSHRKQTLQPGIEWANVTSVINQMHLEATSLGLGSCYMWGALESMRMLPQLDHTDLLQLPQDFEPLCALAVGYPAQALQKNAAKHEITVNRI